jgi:hypothetical protein
MNQLEQPLNSNERYLYEINIRLNVLIEMFSSFLEVYAKQNDIPTSINTIVEEKPNKVSKKSTKKR